MSPTKRPSPPSYPATKSWKETASSRRPIRALRSQGLSSRVCSFKRPAMRSRWGRMDSRSSSPRVSCPGSARRDNAGSFAAAIRSAGHSGWPPDRVWGSTTLVHRRVHGNREFLLRCVVRALLHLRDPLPGLERLLDRSHWRGRRHRRDPGRLHREPTSQPNRGRSCDYRRDSRGGGELLRNPPRNARTRLRLFDRDGIRRGPGYLVVQHQPGEPAAVPGSRPPSGTAQRDDALPRLGHPPHWKPRGRGSRRSHRGVSCAGHRGRRWAARSPLGLLFPGPGTQDDSAARRRLKRVCDSRPDPVHSTRTAPRATRAPSPRRTSPIIRDKNAVLTPSFSARIAIDRPPIHTRLIEPATNKTIMKSQQHPTQYSECRSPILHAPTRPDRQWCMTNPMGEVQWFRHTAFVRVTCHAPAATSVPAGISTATPVHGPTIPSAINAKHAATPNAPHTRKYAPTKA